MASQELLASWARTENLLSKARALLSPEVERQHETSISQMVEFIEHNELGHAFDWMKSIAEESQWCDVELLGVLFRAAENIKHVNDANVLRQRIFELS
jgi:hypothetical protein